jgi:hypothetical protein
MMLVTTPACGQDEHVEHQAKHVHDKHNLGILIAETLKKDKELFTLGVEYAYYFKKKAALGGAVEYLESDDLLFAFMAFAKPGLGSLKVVAGPGVKFSLKDNDDNQTSRRALAKLLDEGGEDGEAKYFLRLGVQYPFFVGQRLIISPLVENDFFGGKEDWVVGGFFGVHF